MRVKINYILFLNGLVMIMYNIKAKSITTYKLVATIGKDDKNAIQNVTHVYLFII